MYRDRRIALLKISLMILILLILIVGIYLGYKSYSHWRENKNLEIFQKGATYGYSQAVLQIINVSDTCKPFPVYAGDQSRELISVTCFK